MALSAEEKERIMAERGESGRIATGKMRRFSIKFTGEKVTTMLDPQGRNIIDIWEHSVSQASDIHSEDTLCGNRHCLS